MKKLELCEKFPKMYVTECFLIKKKSLFLFHVILESKLEMSQEHVVNLSFEQFSRINNSLQLLKKLP